MTKKELMEFLDGAADDAKVVVFPKVLLIAIEDAGIDDAVTTQESYEVAAVRKQTEIIGDLDSSGRITFKDVIEFMC